MAYMPDGFKADLKQREASPALEIGIKIYIYIHAASIISPGFLACLSKISV